MPQGTGGVGRQSQAQQLTYLPVPWVNWAVNFTPTEVSHGRLIGHVYYGTSGGVNVLTKARKDVKQLERGVATRSTVTTTTRTFAQPAALPVWQPADRSGRIASSGLG